MQVWVYIAERHTNLGSSLYKVAGDPQHVRVLCQLQ